MKGINNTQIGFGRPALDQIFNEGEIPKEVRNKAIGMAYREFKYPLKEIARHLNMNPNYLCDILKRLET
jgi:AraC-like DNA-binding protein